MKSISKIVLLVAAFTVVAASLVLTGGTSKKGEPGKPFAGTTINVAMIDEPREQVLNLGVAADSVRRFCACFLSLSGMQEL